MLGILDSGIGGYSSLREIRRLCDRVDIVYLADYKNAPYGVKDERTLVPIVSENIERLLSLGCERVLIACCTASAMHKHLRWELAERSTEIISPTVKEISKSGASRVTLIATERTVMSSAFDSVSRFASLTKISAQPLVSIVERGAWEDEYISALVGRIRESTPDTLILGCTHFSYIEKRLRQELPNINIVSPATLGAREGAKEINNLGTCRVEYI